MLFIFNSFIWGEMLEVSSFAGIQMLNVVGGKKKTKNKWSQYLLSPLS